MMGGGGPFFLKQNLKIRPTWEMFFFIIQILPGLKMGRIVGVALNEKKKKRDESSVYTCRVN